MDLVVLSLCCFLSFVTWVLETVKAHYSVLIFLTTLYFPVVNISIGRLRSHTPQQGQEALQVRSELFFRRLAELPRYFVSND